MMGRAEVPLSVGLSHELLSYLFLHLQNRSAEANGVVSPSRQDESFKPKALKSNSRIISFEIGLKEIG